MGLWKRIVERLEPDAWNGTQEVRFISVRLSNLIDAEDETIHTHLGRMAACIHQAVCAIYAVGIYSVYIDCVPPQGYNKKYPRGGISRQRVVQLRQEADYE